MVYDMFGTYCVDITMKAVYTVSDWPESPEEEILVTYVMKDETESDAILRAMEIFGSRYGFYIK